jgi:3-deoxy-7-phosphoheptulonate synthase
VILCERGVRTFCDHARFTLDLSIVPALERVSDLPIIVDPSHASGDRALVPPLARAALAVGADGVLIEVHPEPAAAWCDGPQSLDPAELAALVADLRAMAPLVAKAREAVS